MGEIIDWNSYGCSRAATPQQGGIHNLFFDEGTPLWTFMVIEGKGKTLMGSGCVCEAEDVVRQAFLWIWVLSTWKTECQVFLIFFNSGLVCNLPIMNQHMCWYLM